MIVEKIRSTANEIIERCAKEGIIVQMYEAKSTSTIYIRLDKGALGTIRISDHQKRSESMHCRYNIVEGESIGNGFYKRYERTYAGLDDVDYILRKILKDRYNLIMRHGSLYKEFMYFNSNRSGDPIFKWYDEHTVHDKFFTRNKKLQLKIALPKTLGRKRKY